MGRTIKQKEIVLDTLKSLKTHPTIKELYEEVKKKDNTIGQATVYRNINKLYDNGLIRKVQVGDNIDHYDGNLNSHYHLKCNECGKIMDIFDNRCNELISTICKEQKIEVDNYELILSGKCSKCISKEKEN